MAKLSHGLIIIGCGKAKIWDRRRGVARVKARDAYVGSLFKSARRFAEKRGAKWLILSAKYGLLRPSRLISDYDISIGAQSAITAEALSRQWQRLRNRPTVAVCLASKSYVKLLRDAIPDSVAIRTPLDGMDLFERMRWLKAHS